MGLLEVSRQHKVVVNDLRSQVAFISDWKVHASPEPVVSFRTLVVCRFLHLPSTDALARDTTSNPWEPNITANHDYEEDSYERWKACVLGYVDDVSSRNEDEVRKTILAICDQVLADAVTGLGRVDAYSLKEASTMGPPPLWVSFAAQCIKHLWQEQADVALAVRTHVMSGAAL